MDLLDFEAQGLYFEKHEPQEITALLALAAENYSDGAAELPLLKAYFKAPESLNVLVALNRFYYYQHRLEDALNATYKALTVIRVTINFPEDWRDLQSSHVDNAPYELLTEVRLYLFTLKAIGFLNMRLHQLEPSREILEKLVALDPKNRIGAQELLDLLKNF